jgi:cobalt-zinc-cadmium efflux system protein
MALSVAILIVELAAGFYANSLALIADASHVFADVSGIALSLGAIRLANRPTSASRSFGLYRVEILAAAANALLLLAVSAFVIFEGVRRLSEPPEVNSTVVIGIALLAVAANIVSVALLAGGRRESFLVRGAFLGPR